MPATTWGEDVAPRVGKSIYPDGWSGGWGRLEAGDGFSTFRVRPPSADYGIITSLPVEVEVTGRTLQHAHSQRVVRVKITFPGDGEPDTVTHGWMVVPW